MVGRMSTVSMLQNSSSVEGRRPNCARCRNHFERTQLKGHKRYCKYKNCKCERCMLTQQRQLIMAKQTAERRRQQQDEERAKDGLPVSSPPPPEASQQQQSEVISAPAPSSPVSVPTTSTSNNVSNSGPVQLESILILLNMLQNKFDTYSLLYVILRYVTPDISDAYRRILEAQEELGGRGRKLYWPPYYTSQTPATTIYKPHSSLGKSLPWSSPLYNYRYPPYFITAPYTAYELKPRGENHDCIPKLS